MTTGEGTIGPSAETLAPIEAPPGPLLNGVVAALLAVTLWQGSERTSSLDAFILLGSAWFFLMLLWAYRFVLDAGNGTLQRRHALRWLWAPTLFVVTIVLVFGGYAQQARFSLSRGALDAAADTAMVGRAPLPGWLGLYPVERITRLANGVRFDVPGQYALVRDAPLDANDSVVRYIPIDGRWSVEIELQPYAP